MNALKTFVHQIETFGKLESEYSTSICKVRYYRIDTVTRAVVYYKKDGKPKQASFMYGCF